MRDLKQDLDLVIVFIRETWKAKYVAICQLWINQNIMSNSLSIAELSEKYNSIRSLK